MTDVQPVEQTKRDQTQTKQTKKEREAAIKYDAIVADAKRLIKVLESNTMQLGELADRVKAEYGEEKLAQFARDIGIKIATVARWRSVYRKWKGIEAPEPVSPSVRKALQGLPDPVVEKILREKPKLTVRQAHTHARDWRAGHPDEQWQVRHTRGWIGQAEQHATGAIQYGRPAAEHLDPANLRQALDNPEQTIAALRRGGEALIRLADELERVLALLPTPMFDDAAPSEAAPPLNDVAPAEATPNETVPSEVATPNEAAPSD
jgi:hypothetical protein